MEHIEKRNGYVWFVKEHDVYGRHKTIIRLGKDPDYIESKPKKTKKSED